MSIFDDDGPLFTDTGIWGEVGRFIPKVGAPREVECVVHRLPPQTALSGGGRVLEYRCIVEVANNSTNGISREELNLGADKFEICPERPGGTVEQIFIQKPDDGRPWIDGGMMRLALK